MGRAHHSTLMAVSGDDLEVLKNVIALARAALRTDPERDAPQVKDILASAQKLADRVEDDLVNGWSR